MRVGTQFTGTVNPNASHTWFTFNWPAAWDVVWTVVSDSAAPGAPQISWDTAVERASGDFVTYWITVTNSTPAPVNVEARFAVLNI